MAQVMYDRAILFDGQVYSVTQTWNGPDIVVTVAPENEKLRALISDLLLKRGQITFYWRGEYFEIVQPS